MSVSDRGSFTLGAAAARVTQSVASRRIAALERYFGGELIDRSTRRVTLTPFGLDMLPAARRLVDLAADLRCEAERARASPVRVAMPDTCSVGDLARVVAAAGSADIVLDPRAALPEERSRLVRSLEVRAGVVSVPPGEARWSVPLGFGSADTPTSSTVYLDSLRAGRSDGAARYGAAPPRRVWIQPEDDVPHIRDRVMRARDAVGLQPAQVAVAPSLTLATADVFASRNLLLCSARQASELGLHWSRIGELDLVRGYDLSAGSGVDADRILAAAGDTIGRALGLEPLEPPQATS